MCFCVTLYFLNLHKDKLFDLHEDALFDRVLMKNMYINQSINKVEKNAGGAPH